MRQLTVALKPSPFGPDLSACIAQEARGLPIGQLRTLAHTGSALPPAERPLVAQLIGDCLRHGKGLTAFRAAVASSIRAHIAPGLPAVYTQCAVTKSNSLTIDQLVSTIAHPGAGFQIGVQLGLQCLREPAVFSALRGSFITSIKASTEASTLPAAFKACLLQKANGITQTQLEQLLIQRINGGAAAETASAQALGRSWAQQCVASGIKP
jgi:hypothetical protein